MIVPERQLALYDFEICFGEDALKRVIAKINYNGYELAAVTQDGDKYTVFFRRASV